SAILSVLAIPVLYASVAERKAPAAPAVSVPVLPEERYALASFVTFPELDDFVMESTTLPRMMIGETVRLDAEVFRGVNGETDAAALLQGEFRVERAEIAFTSAYGELQGKQYVTLRSAVPPAPVWRVFENA
ncbi:MAG TPA: hypothetical protein VNG31_06050, partial [Candidatus Baltobacteraceae bacterium]|nr:hypothetical protein [Candidatus Baltobacteraceae bacterium]